MFVWKWKYDALKEQNEVLNDYIHTCSKSNEEHVKKIKRLGLRVRELEAQLIKAQKNDHRDSKGRFTKRAKK